MRLNRLPTILILMATLLFLAGCAATPSALEQKMERKIVVAEPAPPPAGEKQVPSPRSTEDRELFAEGLALLNQPDRPDQAKARAVFVSLLDRYPQSKWRAASETFIRLIDEIAVSREEGRRDRLLAERILALLAGIVLLSSAKMAKYIAENVPGIFVPQYLIDELASAPKGGALNKGIEIAGRMIATLKKEALCDGVHIMAIGREEVVPDILKAAELSSKAIS